MAAILLSYSGELYVWALSVVNLDGKPGRMSCWGCVMEAGRRHVINQRPNSPPGSARRTATHRPLK